MNYSSTALVLIPNRINKTISRGRHTVHCGCLKTKKQDKNDEGDISLAAYIAVDYHTTILVF